MTKNALTFLALLWIVERNTVTYWTSNQLQFKETVLRYPLLVNRYQLRLLIHLIVLYRFLLYSFLHSQLLLNNYTLYRSMISTH